MKSSPARSLLWGQVGFLGCLAICFGLVPSYLHSEGGVSNYGTLRETVIFYTLAFLSEVYFCSLAARQLHGPSLHALKRALYALAVLFALVLFSTYPYKLNDGFRLIHELTGISLFAFETVFCCWLGLVVARSWWRLLWLLVFLAGAFMAFITLIGATHMLFIGQTITAVAFAALVVSSVQRVTAAG